MKRLMIAIAAALVFSFFAIGGEANAPQPAQTPEISVKTDRDFGYFVGDPVTVKYEIRLPADQKFTLQELPRSPLPVSQGIEIKNLTIKEEKGTEFSVYRIEITFQIFRVSKETRYQFIPAIVFYYGPEGKPREHQAAMPKIGIKVSPLCGEEDPILQPFFFPEKEIPNVWFALILGGAALTVGGWIWLAKIIICQRRHPSSLKNALKALRKIKAHQTAEILAVFRKALNDKAGKAIFASNLEDLFRVFPKARVFSGEILALIELSDNISFNPNYQKNIEELMMLKSSVAATLRRLKRKETWA